MILKQFQKDGVEWMMNQETSGMMLGGILADDMGLGKTAQAVELVARRAEIGKTLIVCPKSVIGHWQAELNRFEKLRVLVLTCPIKAKQQIVEYDVVVTTYNRIQLMFSSRSRYSVLVEEWGRIILDEGHRIKGRVNITTRALRSLTAKHRWCLTGTPIQNRPSELFSMIQFLRFTPWSEFWCESCTCRLHMFPKPGHCRDCGHPTNAHFSFFKRNITEKVRASSSPDDMYHKIVFNRLRHRIVNKLMLRRNLEDVKEEVWLPKLETKIIYTKPTEKEWNIYTALERQCYLEFRTAKGHFMHQFALLSKLKQAVIDLRLVKGCPSIGGRNSARIDSVIKLISTLNGTDKALVFSQYTRVLDFIESSLPIRTTTKIVGSMSNEQRTAAVHRFTEDSAVRCLLVSKAAGGEGLNLQVANIVILVEPNWNPSLDLQVIKRAHRIGQTRPVKIFKMITKNTIEERILELQETKTNLTDAVTEGSIQAWVRLLMKSDIKRLFYQQN